MQSRERQALRVIAGLLLAVGCALAGSVAVLLKQPGAAPTVVARQHGCKIGRSS